VAKPVGSIVSKTDQAPGIVHPVKQGSQVPAICAASLLMTLREGGGINRTWHEERQEPAARGTQDQ
jgi:hypothetical protein